MTKKTERNARLRRRRSSGASLRALARSFSITVTQVRRVLEATGGDPLRSTSGGADLAGMTIIDLERERIRLADRIAADRRRLRLVDDELDVRRTDRVLGLTG